MTFNNPFQPGYDLSKKGHNQADRIRITSDRSRVQYLLDTPDDWRGHAGDVLIVHEDDDHLIFTPLTASSITILPPIAGLDSTSVYDAVIEIKDRLDAVYDGVHGNGSVTQHYDVRGAGSGRIITDVERDKLNAIEEFAKDDQNAIEVPITNIPEIAAATEVQTALELLASKIFLAITNIGPITIIPSVTSEIDVFSPVQSTPIEWTVHIRNSTAGTSCSYKILANYYDNGAAIDWTTYSILGDALSVVTDIQVLGASVVYLFITNNETDNIEVFTSRMPVFT